MRRTLVKTNDTRAPETESPGAGQTSSTRFDFGAGHRLSNVAKRRFRKNNSLAPHFPRGETLFPVNQTPVPASTRGRNARRREITKMCHHISINRLKCIAQAAHTFWSAFFTNSKSRPEAAARDGHTGGKRSVCFSC